MLQGRMWLAAGVIVSANLAALGGVALDRRGGPQATLVLTERELPLPPKERENTALALRLRWTDPAPYDREHAMDRAQLEDLGYDCSPPLEGDHLARYRSAPPRKVFAALEYDGEAWRQYAERLESEMAHLPEPERAERRRTRDLPGPQPGGTSPELELAGSRLVVVDVGPDRDALGQRYANRANVVIVQAVVRLLVGEDREGLYLTGRVVGVHPLQLNVPSRLRAVLEPLRAEVPSRPGKNARYEVTVRWGRRAPWITGVRAATGPD